jgi:hypothetical protein
LAWQKSLKDIADDVGKVVEHHLHRSMANNPTYIKTLKNGKALMTIHRSCRMAFKHIERVNVIHGEMQMKATLRYHFPTIGLGKNFLRF